MVISKNIPLPNVKNVSKAEAIIMYENVIILNDIYSLITSRIISGFEWKHHCRKCEKRSYSEQCTAGSTIY